MTSPAHPILSGRCFDGESVCAVIKAELVTIQQDRAEQGFFSECEGFDQALVRI